MVQRTSWYSERRLFPRLVVQLNLPIRVLQIDARNEPRLIQSRENRINIGL